MSAEHLREFIDNVSLETLEEWLLQLRVMAKLYIERQRKSKWGSIADNIEPREIVNETIDRILSSRVRYVWDGTGDFDCFMLDCVYRSIEFCYSELRRHAGRQVEIGASLVELDANFSTPPAQLNVLQVKQFTQEVSAILSPNVTGQRRAYAEMLPQIVAEGRTSEEVAKILEITDATLKEFRKRLRSDIKRRDTH